MKFTPTALAVAGAFAGSLVLSACSKPADQATTATDTTTAKAVAPTYGSDTTNWFGGPIYSGQPSLAATAALVKAGGGADSFNFATALVSMLGKKTVDAEVAKLTTQYGKAAVDSFIDGMTFAVKDGLKQATAKGIALPAAPADLKGAALAKGLVKAGTAPDGTFWSGYMFDMALSHPLHVAVMADIDTQFSHAADDNTHKILNQAMYDVAQALGMKDVKLSPFH